MALVECKECGSGVSDGAVTCPSCGVAGPAGAGKLLVTRQKQLMGGFFPVSVAVDGVGHGRLMPGGQMELELHQVATKWFWVSLRGTYPDK